ncbi:MAG: hypothetical protein DMG15_06905 [Acidobacteria bacterium]|nr:MAG: hypothetical protein DMG16_26540 [Acidobacteriota bacterium]PYS14765.1 MAG: hypothetical protein DMG15_06905 [Acidobacteriota bacterium]
MEGGNNRLELTVNHKESRVNRVRYRLNRFQAEIDYLGSEVNRFEDKDVYFRAALDYLSDEEVYRLRSRSTSDRFLDRVCLLPGCQIIHTEPSELCGTGTPGVHPIESITRVSINVGG